MELLNTRYFFRLLIPGKHFLCPLQKLFLPLSELVRMPFEALRQLNYRLFSLNCLQCYLCLECRSMVPSRSLCHLSCSFFLFAGSNSKFGFAICPIRGDQAMTRSLTPPCSLF